MVDFAPWLAKVTNIDPMTDALKDFAKANGDKWPAGSNSVEDYHKVITATASSGQRDELLIALGRLYERWFEQERQGFWKQVGAHPGLAALFIGGLIIAIGLAYGIFFNESFFDLMAQADHARGLITFLFSFATIGIMVLVAIAIFWMDRAEVDARFAHAKDLITVLVGILGTVLGFYFGTTSTSGAPRKFSVSAVTVAPNSASAGDTVRVSTKTSGGSSPYQYDVIFDGSSGGFDADKMNIRGGRSSTGEVSEQVVIPVEVPKRVDLTTRIVVRDASGAQAEAPAVKLTISPKAVVGPPKSVPSSDNK